MKKTNFFGIAFSLLFVFVLSSATALAQSTDPDNPTVLTQNVIQGKNLSDTKTVVYYYAFTAGPGIVKVTLDFKATIYATNLDWTLMDVNFNDLGHEFSNADTSGTRKIKELKLNKKQRVILKLEVSRNVASYKIQFDGAVNFTPVKSGDNENIPEITGDTTTQSTQQICMPRNGVLIMTMQDGKKAKIDLSKVQKIEVQ